MPSSVDLKKIPGIYYAFPAFLIWGMSAIYWGELRGVPAFEVLMHRMVWSCVFLAPALFIRSIRTEILLAIKTPSSCIALIASTILVSANWFTFIWAIHHGHVLQTSLGYYINPLVQVFLGVIVLNEKLRTMQWAAVGLACIGVSYLAVSAGEIPLVSLMLAFSFAFYGLIRKTVSVSAVAGLFIETLFLSVPAGVYLSFLAYEGTGTFGMSSPYISLLLIGSSLVTALPLLLFNLGARRMTLSAIGFMQYIAPTCTFFLGIFYFNEPMDIKRLGVFMIIWAALFVFSIDSWRNRH